MAATVKIVSNRLPGFADRLKVKADTTSKSTAEQVAEIARKLAPRDTGELINSISIEAQEGEDGWEVVVGADHGIFVELGTSKMAAQPYLTPAAEAMRNDHIKRSGDIVEEVA